MPEEINRVITDHLSYCLFPPTEKAKNNLMQEGIRSNVFITGNTIVDAVYQAKGIAAKHSDILEKMGLKPKNYVLVTSHRQENVDDHEKLASILDGIKKVGSELGLPVVFPMHPRTRSRVREFSLNMDGIIVTNTIGYLNFLNLEMESAIILTDSGGVQEEACILGVPCVTMRENTERPETVEAGANIIAGTDPNKLLCASKAMLSSKNGWINPFGDGKASSRIIEIICDI